MKLRLRDDSVRLRLMRGEVDVLRATGRVDGVTRFPGGESLDYGIRCDANAASPAAAFAGARLTVTLPESQVADWAGGDAVALAGCQPLAGGGELSILVEKDFQCLAPRPGEDESDMFPHPAAADPGRQ